MVCLHFNFWLLLACWLFDWSLLEHFALKQDLLYHISYLFAYVELLMMQFFWREMVGVRGVDPYGTGGTCPSPNIYEGGDVHRNVPPNILEVMWFISFSNSNNCCLLYFTANIV